MSLITKQRMFPLASVALVLLAVGCKKQPNITLSCNATPPSVFPGEPVTVEGKADSISTKKHNNVLYNWTGTGVTADGATARVATGALTPGSYTVNGEVKEGKKGKEGLKPGQSATCSTSFSVKDFEPPTVSCSASPSTLLPNGSSTINCTGTSPQNRPLTYSYSATAGSVTGAGSSATFSATGAATGPVAINCKVQDDKNHTASTDTTITIQAPPAPPVPHVQSLCSISFERDKKRPTRVSNEAKACLDDIALTLQASPDAKAILVADATAKEKDTTAKEELRAAKHKHAKVRHFAEQRAVNTKDYLVREKGIDPARITLAVGPGDDQSVQNYLAPAGANVSADVQQATWISESGFTAEERVPLHQSRKRTGSAKH